MSPTPSTTSSRSVWMSDVSSVGWEEGSGCTSISRLRSVRHGEGGWWVGGGVSTFSLVWGPERVGCSTDRV